MRSNLPARTPRVWRLIDGVPAVCDLYPAGACRAQNVAISDPISMARFLKYAVLEVCKMMIDDTIAESTRAVILDYWVRYRQSGGRATMRSFSTYIKKPVDWTRRRMLAIPELAERMGFELCGDPGAERLVYTGKQDISNT